MSIEIPRRIIIVCPVSDAMPFCRALPSDQVFPTFPVGLWAPIIQACGYGPDADQAD